MAKLRVHDFTITLDGYAAGTNQRADAPFGDGVAGLHDWLFATRIVREMEGRAGGDEGIDNEYVARGEANIGATIMGRNMFGPVRGPWPDESWTGWWGEDPPFHHDVFVLTHHPRRSVSMAGGTTFHFVDGAPDTVLARAVDAAGGKDVRLGGGASTIQQFLRAGLVDEMHVAITPLLAGAGERLFDNVGDALAGYRCAELVGSKTATHAWLTRRPAG